MKIKLLRLQEGISQQDFAKKINIPRTKYARYESGETKIPLDVLTNIANYFDVSLDYLCDRQWNNQVGYIPEERKDFIQTIINLDEDDFKEIKSYVNGFMAGRTKSEDFNVFD